MIQAPCLIFVGKAGANPSEATAKGPVRTYDTHHNDTQQKTFSIMTFGITTIKMRHSAYMYQVLFMLSVTNKPVMLSVFMLKILCFVFECFMLSVVPLPVLLMIYSIYSILFYLFYYLFYYSINHFIKYFRHCKPILS